MYYQLSYKIIINEFLLFFNTLLNYLIYHFKLFLKINVHSYISIFYLYNLNLMYLYLILLSFFHHKIISLIHYIETINIKLYITIK